jgi:hypothetical protein
VTTNQQPDTGAHPSPTLGGLVRALFDRFGRRTVIAAAIGVALLLAIGVGVLIVAGSDGGLFGSSAKSSGSLDVYRGLASWVDLYDTRAWKDPAAAVKDMAGHGVRTIFIETANSSSASGLVHPSALAEFIVEAHARHMFVVAWYLPNLRSSSLDYDRAIQAIQFTSSDGQTFDSFALDIESTTVKPVSTRNKQLAALSARIRSRVGSGYVLGAIIPSPVGLSSTKSHWKGFPYAMLAKTYDVFLLMHYYTFDIRSAATTYTSTLANMRVLRAQPGCATTPVHMIGGISNRSSIAQVRQFVRAVRKTGCIGASLYDWAGTNAAKWHELASVETSVTP